MVSGLEEFDYELRRLGDVKPILGIEAYLTDDVNNIMTNRPILDSAGRPKIDKKTGEPMFEKQRPRDFNHGCMWAENDKGLENLFTLSTLSYDTGFYRKPRIDLAMMRDHHDGLFVSDGCLLSQVARAAVDAAQADDDRAAQRAVDRGYDWIRSLVDIFGRDHVLIELHTWQFTNPGDDERSLELNRQMRSANALKLQIARDLGLMTIAVNDAHYGPREDYEWHELEWSTTTKKGEDYNDDKTDGRGETAAWVMNDDEVRYWLGRHGLPEDAIEEAIENTSRIADACDAHINRQLNPPRFCDTREDDEDLFDRTIMDGFRELVPKKRASEYMDRLNREVELIKKCDLTGYFNTVADYANFVRAEDPDGEIYGVEGKHASLLGPSRGSAGGSLVCFLMHITNMDPIRFDLIFERFLTAGRVISTVHVSYEDGSEHSYDPSDMVTLSDGSQEESWHLLDEAGIETADGVVSRTWFDFHDCPDIDLDFTAEVIPYLNAYLKKRYGEHNFCHIGTFQELKLASAIKDIARVDGISPQEALRYVRDLESAGWPMNDSVSEHTFEELWRCIALSADLMDLGKDFWERVWQWCGRYRSEGIHASGYIISKTSLMGRVPLRIKKGEELYTSQWDYDSIVRCGFIKFDILKLSSLDTITEVYRLTHDGDLDVQEAYREMRDERLLKGKALWKPTWDGDTLGIFQMDTKLGTTTAMNARIRSLRDAGMLSAADRPGLVRSGLIDEFYKVRLGQMPPNHYHPLIDDILEETDGFILYQEQIMSIYQRMCGMTMGEADNVRKIFSKKKLDKVEAMKNLLHDSCLSDSEFVRLTPDKYRDAEDCFNDIWRGLSRTAEYSFNKSHCVAGDTVLYLPDGSKTDVRTLFLNRYNNGDRSQTYIYQLQPDGTVSPGLISSIQCTGIRRVILIRTRSGRSIMVTPDHRLLSEGGYQRADHLHVGDHLVSVDMSSIEYDSSTDPLDVARCAVQNESRYSMFGARMFARTCAPGSSIFDLEPYETLTGAVEKYLHDRGVLFDELSLRTVGVTTIGGERICTVPKILAMPMSRGAIRLTPSNYRYVIDSMLMSSAAIYHVGEHDCSASWDEIVSIENTVDMMTYDISMDDHYPMNFIANGIVSHNSQAYGMITSIEELYKVNYPAEFITASLNTDPSDVRFISYARSHGIRISPPNVNLSGSRYELRDGVIYMPLHSIKGIGAAAVSEIHAGAPYSSFEDYLDRTSGRGGKKKDVMTSLISIGAFDGVDPRDRFDLMCLWKTMRKEDPPKRNTWKSARVRGRIEERLIGVSLSYDPVLDNREMLEQLGPQSMSDVMKTDIGDVVSIAGEIVEIRRHNAKTGEMAWVKIRLVSHDDVEVTVFPSKWSGMRDLLQSHDLVCVTCKRSDDYNGKLSLVALKVRNLSLESTED